MRQPRNLKVARVCRVCLGHLQTSLTNRPALNEESPIPNQVAASDRDNKSTIVCDGFGVINDGFANRQR